MLIYLGRGARSYGDKPISVFERPVWEFQAVIKGTISMLHPQGPDLLKGRRLWVSPPRHLHGWTGVEGEPAEVAVFHFRFVPPALECLFRTGGVLEVGLSEKQCGRMRELAEQASKYWASPSVGMTLCYEHILLELSLLVVEASGTGGGSPHSGVARQRVDHAMRWFAEHMEENPSLEEISAVVGSSPAHLRRMFWEVMDASPKKIFDQLRFQRSMLLIFEAEMTFEQVAERCGFTSASVFSRAFKNKFGCCPHRWRAPQ